MKTQLIPSIGTITALVDKSNEAVLGERPDVQVVMVENPMTPIPENRLVLNTCVGVQNLLINEELRRETWKMLEIENQPEVSRIFGLFNGENFSEWLEVSHSERFMDREVGPLVGFSTGVGLRPQDDVQDAIPTIIKVKDFLAKLNYHGEVLIALTDRFSIAGIGFGHFYGHFAMFRETSMENSTQALIDFMAGQHPQARLHGSIVVANLVSQQPFPIFSADGKTPIAAPNNAEKHLWRLKNVSVETVLVTTHGKYLAEAQARLRRTLENMAHYNRDIQYRSDYGRRGRFVLCQARYDELKKMRWQKPSTDDSPVEATPDQEKEETSKLSPEGN